MSLSQATDDNFEAEVLQSEGPVVVDFWAEWCGPCQMLTPVLEEVAAEMGDKVKVVKMNIDENPNTPAQFGVRSIPTMIIFKDGQPVDTKVGVLPKGKIVEWIGESS